MKNQVDLLPFGLSDLFAQVNDTGSLTVADRYGLMAALLEESLSDEEKSCIDRLLRAVCRGKIKVANDISSIMM
ncbi:MAG: hypothetical protein ACRC2J_02365 [Microcoleaceae cyanobacterium]